MAKDSTTRILDAVATNNINQKPNQDFGRQFYGVLQQVDEWLISNINSNNKDSLIEWRDKSYQINHDYMMAWQNKQYANFPLQDLIKTIKEEFNISLKIILKRYLKQNSKTYNTMVI